MAVAAAVVVAVEAVVASLQCRVYTPAVTGLHFPLPVFCNIFIAILYKEIKGPLNS